jgi:hypothetical protein
MGIASTRALLPAGYAWSGRTLAFPWLFRTATSSTRSCEPVIDAKVGSERGIEFRRAYSTTLSQRRSTRTCKTLDLTSYNLMTIRNFSHFKEQGWRNIEEQDEAGNTPLLKAALDGDSEGIEVLLKAGADINAKNKVCKILANSFQQKRYKRNNKTELLLLPSS